MAQGLTGQSWVLGLSRGAPVSRHLLKAKQQQCVTYGFLPPVMHFSLHIRSHKLLYAARGSTFRGRRAELLTKAGHVVTQLRRLPCRCLGPPALALRMPAQYALHYYPAARVHVPSDHRAACQRCAT